jgi:hypothetical protein
VFRKEPDQSRPPSKTRKPCLGKKLHPKLCGFNHREPRMKNGSKAPIPIQYFLIRHSWETGINQPLMRSSIVLVQSIFWVETYQLTNHQIDKTARLQCHILRKHKPNWRLFSPNTWRTVGLKRVIEQMGG